LQRTPTGNLAILIFEVVDADRMFAGVDNSGAPLDAGRFSISAR
jgi:hypothetical protein